MSKDYYKILGVTEFETAENIKLAYRKLARKWHPDVAGNTQDVLLKFKEINEAYEILSNKVQKAEYDKARKFYSYAQAEKKQYRQDDIKTTSNPKKEDKKRFNFNWEEFISKRHKEEGFKEQQNLPKRGEDISFDVEITFFEAISGVSKLINVLQTQICPKCSGRKFVNGTICNKCNGNGELTNHKKFTVKIPAGIKNNSKIRLAGEGGYGLYGGKRGDLYITVHVKEQQNCKTEGLNIYKTIPITPFEAVLGADIKLSTLKGTISVKIPANTQNGQKIRLAGCGIVQNEKVGDMIIQVEITIPKKLSNKEIELYKQLQQISNNNIRENIYD